MSCEKCSFRPAAKKYVRDQIPVISKKEAQMKESAMLFGGLAIGLAAGIVIGAGIVALTAPQSGEETRQDIRDKKDFAVSGVKEKSSQVANKVKDSADGFVGKVKDKFKGGDEEEVVVEYTIHYDDEDEATVEPAVAEAEAEEPAADEEKPEA